MVRVIMVIRKKMEPNGHQARVIGHHLAQNEEIPISGYWDRSLDGLTHWQMDWQKHKTFKYISYILGFTFYRVIIVTIDCIVDVVICWHPPADDIPRCEVPTTDFYMIVPQMTSTEQLAMVINYLAIGWTLAGYWL